MRIQLIRHATLIISIDNKKILVDPVLSKAGTIAPIADVPNQNLNPLVELPIVIDNIVDCDAVLVTHTHGDHFDEAAVKLLPKSIPLFCQIQDYTKITSYGFNNVQPIIDTYIWNNISFNRTEGQHGHGETALEMAPVSGFVISSLGEASVYIAGDTVWCIDVEDAIEKFNPEIVVCNCGGAQFSYGKPITMTTEDIYVLSHKYENLKIVAVHMEAWNHCRLSRKELKDYIIENNIETNVFIPEDGDALSF
ncbi:MAG TPA: MBL fold metallo-hydrolase [Clostridiaceae bacterium]